MSADHNGIVVDLDTTAEGASVELGAEIGREGNIDTAARRLELARRCAFEARADAAALARATILPPISTSSIEPPEVRVSTSPLTS